MNIQYGESRAGATLTIELIDLDVLSLPPSIFEETNRRNVAMGQDRVISNAIYALYVYARELENQRIQRLARDASETKP